jgi:hypothetical protein
MGSRFLPCHLLLPERLQVRQLPVLLRQLPVLLRQPPVLQPGRSLLPMPERLRRPVRTPAPKLP